MESKIKKIIIFGDSYSTHENIIPEGYKSFYYDDGKEGGPAVTKMQMQDTWWYKFLSHIGGKLLRNDSWSGSTIGYTGYKGVDCSRSSSFIYRYRKLKEEGFFEENKPDTVIVFGGTNDNWSDAPLGEIKISGWEEEDLFSVLPAICYFAHTLKEDFPDAEIIFIINTELKEEIPSCMEYAAKKYGLKAVRLENISKENGHPTKKGMAQIRKQILKKLV